MCRFVAAGIDVWAFSPRRTVFVEGCDIADHGAAGHSITRVQPKHQWRDRVWCGMVSTARISEAVSDGVLPTLTPAASSASFFAEAVPDDPETMAPACPIVLPSGAVNPAT